MRGFNYETVIRRRDRRTSNRLLEFILPDIAEAKGVTLHAIYAAIKRDILRPKELRSIAKYVLTKKKDEVCQLCGQPLTPKKGVCTTPTIGNELVHESKK